MNPARPVLPEQREVLRQALGDAVHYRDPRVQCRACAALDGLCDDCAAGLARARAYVTLGRELGIEVPLWVAGTTETQPAGRWRATAMRSLSSRCWSWPHRPAPGRCR